MIIHYTISDFNASSWSYVQDESTLRPGLRLTWRGYTPKTEIVWLICLTAEAYHYKLNWLFIYF